MVERGSRRSIFALQLKRLVFLLFVTLFLSGAVRVVCGPKSSNSPGLVYNSTNFFQIDFVFFSFVAVQSHM